MASTGVVEKLKAIESSVQTRYPDLRLVVADDQPFLRGSFPVEHEGQEIDRFLVEISFPESTTGLPDVREIGGRIPRHPDRHVSPGTGNICVDVPELILLRGKPTLVEYLDGPVRNFFLSQILFESTKEWRFGQWKHGKLGLLQAYGEVLDVSDHTAIPQYLDYVQRKTLKLHWLCPCGSGVMLRDCHIEELKRLRTKIPKKIARQALERLRTTP